MEWENKISKMQVRPPGVPVSVSSNEVGARPAAAPPNCPLTLGEVPNGSNDS